MTTTSNKHLKSQESVSFSLQKQNISYSPTMKSGIYLSGMLYLGLIYTMNKGTQPTVVCDAKMHSS